MREKWRTSGTRKRIGLVLGVFLFAAVLACPAPAGMPPEARRLAAVALLMITWWISEAIPIPATALVPLALFPLLGIMTSKETAPNYANHIIFLFLGGFLIALAMQRWGLHKRIALRIIHVVGTSPKRLVLGFMLSSAFLSLWISNTATTMMMLPIAMAVVVELSKGAGFRGRSGPEAEEIVQTHFGLVVMLGLAYAASIGGVGTLIGTPPNVIFAGFVRRMFPEAPEIGFFDWMLVGIPFVMLLLPITWVYLVRFASPVRLRDLELGGGGRDVILKEIRGLGPMKSGEKAVAIVFASTAFLWIFRAPIDLGILTIPGWSRFLPFPDYLHDATVAMTMALVLFVLPVRTDGDPPGDARGRAPVMDWRTAQEGVPWGILLLFGGGFALAGGFGATGLDRWIGSQLDVLKVVPVPVMIVAICLLLALLTEVTSNTAITTVMMPILGATAIGMGTHPYLLMIPAAIAASCAFMLPVATPPNAIVFGSGWVTIPRMVRVGVVVELLATAVISVAVYFIAMRVFDITPGVVPAWALS